MLTSLVVVGCGGNNGDNLSKTAPVVKSFLLAKRDSFRLELGLYGSPAEDLRVSGLRVGPPERDEFQAPWPLTSPVLRVDGDDGVASTIGGRRRDSGVRPMLGEDAD